MLLLHLEMFFADNFWIFRVIASKAVVRNAWRNECWLLLSPLSNRSELVLAVTSIQCIFDFCDPLLIIIALSGNRGNRVLSRILDTIYFLRGFLSWWKWLRTIQLHFSSLLLFYSWSRRLERKHLLILLLKPFILFGLNPRFKLLGVALRIWI